ncbi:MAG: TIGR03862 family flavoprotein [Shimia sp.]
MNRDALVIGGGPAGLAAAEVLAAAGHAVTVADRMPTLGRKLLMAGKSGLNLTHDSDRAAHLARIGAPALAPILAAFDAEAVQEWARGLGQEVFTGSSRRVFPTAMKASPLLRAWLARLAGMGVATRPRWRWVGWDDAFALDTPEGPRRVTPGATVLALGGASWSRLGSDGAWAGMLAARGVTLAPFAPANMGVSVAWSPHMAPHLGAPVKGVRLHAGGASARGDLTITARGLEGAPLYALSRAVREGAAVTVDLMPDADPTARLARRGKQSVTSALRRLGLSPAAIALAMEFGRGLPPTRMVTALPLAHDGPRPLDEAISTAGGVPFAALDDHLMLRAAPGVFCAGEMLDWEAQTGGYLLNTCLATGRWAGTAAARWLEG